MLKISNTLKYRYNGTFKPKPENNTNTGNKIILDKIPLNTKLLAWGIFLIFFIENGTLGLVPRQVYFIYRNVRISDLLLYFLTIYSLFNTKEFAELYRSRALVIVKVLIVYLFFQFIVSVISYDYNLIEYFFRLKGIWSTLLIFPFLLLLKREGLPYLIKLILPIAIISNILYILSSVTGVAFLPDIGIEKQTLPGGLQVFRVYGGTFFGEFFFLGFIYNWITNKFRLYQLFLVVLFVIPHILAFGRAAWVYLSFSIIVMAVWNVIRKRNFKMILKQTVILVIGGVLIIYAFTQFIPQSSYLADALGTRVLQGEDNFQNKTGTYGSRLANIDALIGLWASSNILFGIGMHPMWVVKAETEEENIYAWGFSDVRWASVLAAYGLIGFLIAVVFQLYYGFITFKILKRSRSDLLTFFILLFLSTMMFDTFINYSYNLFTVGLWGLTSMVCVSVAALIYKYEHPDSIIEVSAN